MNALPTPDIPSKLEGSKWPRQCVVGWFQKKGKDLVMANTHFDFYPRVQDKSAQLVLEFLSRFPLGLSSVITGDFNADPGSLAYERFMAHGFDEVLKGEKMTTFHGFSGKETFRHIDWILYQGGLILDGVRVVTDDFKGKFPSDHYPVISTFSWKDSPHLP
ncbi:MAG: hypothetical protein HUK40_08325 [Desulfobacter sp.]|nr:hypothetical protein [Desulfobacter sp.]